MNIMEVMFIVYPLFWIVLICWLFIVTRMPTN